MEESAPGPKTRLCAFGPEIWTADGPSVSFFSFPYPTRMALIRLGDGGLFVWSPVALTAELRAEVEALGPPKFLVSPNKLHHLFLGEWKAAFPEAKLLASPGLRRRRKDLVFDADLDDAPDPGWAEDIDQVLFKGSVIMSEAVFFHHASRTAIFADLIENLPRDSVKGWRAVVARLDGVVEPNPGAPREWRLSFLDRKAARAALSRILAWKIERVLIAHGAPREHDAKAFVRRAFAWLS
ncbi:DUF4336 domain-containing protein [Methylocystis bryophila]|uniref:DUF4336 domain-containing protein n=1 Tax=Methylocystis bryophila TaxID=655015 RepID=A0A1W6MRR3_9HYPH|nr:DUF4336 domain-containing protein [Methylocystis bryophila]ARN80169.1 hypothetical protein B1812_02680 [Methylocystis bryophila]BDV40111.1 hypothetical protein DSM21852_33640 [Methylocystis bryophila]